MEQILLYQKIQLILYVHNAIIIEFIKYLVL